jgi:hypothetical protein
LGEEESSVRQKSHLFVVEKFFLLGEKLYSVKGKE